MEEKSLSYTKKRLTIIFTLVIFLIAIILELSFFSFKYYNNQRVSKINFILQSDKIVHKIEKRSDILDFFWLSDIALNTEKLDRDFIDKRKKSKFLEDREISFVVLDEDNQIIQKNIFENIDFEVLEGIKHKTFYIKWGVMVKVSKLKSSILWDKVIFYKKLNYDLEEFLEDILFFSLIILLFSFLFYYIWYKFVSKNLEPVEENLKDMQDFIHNAWHELKTPISVIHSNLQLIKQTKKFDKSLVLEWEEEISRLNKLIETLIELSDINLNLEKQSLKLKDEIDLVIKEFSAEIEKKGINIKLKVKNNFIFKLNKEHFYIMFSNLLKNAIKYSKKWWNIEIISEKNTLSIKDNWSGISEKDLDKVFERFYQWGSSKSQEGFGIWLSLVKKIVDIYRLKISVKSEKWKWSEFIVSF